MFGFSGSRPDQGHAHLEGLRRQWKEQRRNQELLNSLKGPSQKNFSDTKTLYTPRISSGFCHCCNKRSARLIGYSYPRCEDCLKGKNSVGDFDTSSSYRTLFDELLESIGEVLPF